MSQKYSIQVVEGEMDEEDEEPTNEVIKDQVQESSSKIEEKTSG